MCPNCVKPLFIKLITIKNSPFPGYFVVDKLEYEIKNKKARQKSRDVGEFYLGLIVQIFVPYIIYVEKSFKSLH